MADEATERWLDFVLGVEIRLAHALALFREAGGARVEAGCAPPPGDAELIDAELIDAVLGAWVLSERLHGLLRRCGAEAGASPARSPATSPARSAPTSPATSPGVPLPPLLR